MSTPVDQELQTQAVQLKNHVDLYRDGMALADHYASKGEWGHVARIITRLIKQERDWLLLTKRLQELARRSVTTMIK